MQRSTPVGIDLGTTNSAVALVTPAGRTAMLFNEFGSVLTPSVIHFSEDGRIVGHAARKAFAYAAESVATCVKREVGLPQVRQVIEGHRFPPEFLHGCILQHLKRQIDEQVDGPYQAVITVPAFFDERRRKSVEDAARIADLPLLDIVNEPTAAALAYGEQHGFLSESGAPRDTLKVLVYDLGGGTFDVTIIELSAGRVRTLATDGDVQLGGYDWDARLADYAAQKFEGAYHRDPRDDRATLAKLMQFAEEAKETLSTRNKAVIPVEFEEHSRELVITRDQFEALTEDLLERTVHTTHETLHQAKLTWSDIDKVVLSGGATRMPMVTRALETISGRVPDQTVNPDEAVARGAAIYAAFLMQRAGTLESALSIHVVDVNSHSLGMEGVDPLTGRKRNLVLIPRNTPLPAKAVHRFVTREEDQDSIVVRILEGESADPTACIRIGKAVMRNLPSHLSQGHPIEVIYEYQANGRLVVELRICDTDRTMTMELLREGSMTDDRIHQWRTILKSGAKLDDFHEVVREVLGVNVPRASLSQVAPPQGNKEQSR